MASEKPKYPVTGESVTKHTVVICGESVQLDQPVYFGELRSRSNGKWSPCYWDQKTGFQNYAPATHALNLSTFDGIVDTPENQELVEKFADYEPSYSYEGAEAQADDAPGDDGDNAIDI